MVRVFMTVIAPQARSSGMQQPGNSPVVQIRTQAPPTVQARVSLLPATPSASMEPSREPCWISQPCQELSSTHVINSALPERSWFRGPPLSDQLLRSVVWLTPSQPQTVLPQAKYLRQIAAGNLVGVTIITQGRHTSQVRALRSTDQYSHLTEPSQVPHSTSQQSPEELCMQRI